VRRGVAVAGILSALVTLSCISWPEAAAASAYDPVASGRSTLILSVPFLSALRTCGVSLSVVAPATMRGRSVTYRVTGGRLDPVDGIGSVESKGALVLTAGSRSLPIKDLQLKTTRRSSPLAAKFGGGKLKLSSSSRLLTERSGFGLVATVTQMRLSPGVATRLDKKLGIGHTLKGGELVGTARIETTPQTVALVPKGTADVELAPLFQAKLASLLVAANPIFPTEHLGSFDFPIEGGALAPSGAAGRLQTGGALELVQIGGGDVILHELVAELGPSAVLSSELELPPLPGKLPAAPVLSLAGGAVVSEPAARSITLSGGMLALSGSLAAQLNKAFGGSRGGSEIFIPGEALGSLSFVASGE
jgi:hypothetical protein